MKSFDDPITWAEIYLIICVSASIIEEIRKVSEVSFNQARNITLDDTLAGRRRSHTYVGTMAQVWFMDSYFIYIAIRSLLHRHWTALRRNDSTWVVHCGQVKKITHSHKKLIQMWIQYRIILALDLEIWYLFSLRFVSAIKLLGPKLFMIRNMVVSTSSL